MVYIREIRFGQSFACAMPLREGSQCHVQNVCDEFTVDQELEKHTWRCRLSQKKGVVAGSYFKEHYDLAKCRDSKN